MTEMMMESKKERSYGTYAADSQMKVIVLRREELDELYREAAAIGARTALDSMKKEKKEMKSRSKDRRLRNTKLLLRNYRMLKVNIDHSVYKEEQLEESAADILNSMVSHYNDDVIVESIKRSAKRTAIIVSHIDTMLGLYESYCQRAVNYLDQRRYQVIYDMYIDEEPMTAVQVADKHNMSKENVYVDVKAAVETLSALIFGIDGLNVL